MRYKIVAVDPLKPFPLPSFGLANIASLDDAKKQTDEKYEKAATAEIETNKVFQELSAKIKEMSAVLVYIESLPKMSDAHKEEAKKIWKEIKEFKTACEEITEPIREKNSKIAKEEFGFIKMRWPVIEPALTLHLARQERRLAHFKSACRFFNCDNPHPLGSAYFRRFGRDASRGSSAPKSTGQAAMQGTRRHSPQFFCGGHRWLKSQMASGNYAMLSNPKYRVKAIA